MVWLMTMAGRVHVPIWRGECRRDIDLCDDLSFFQRPHKHLPNSCQTYDVRGVIEIRAIKQLSRLLESLDHYSGLEDT